MTSTSPCVALRPQFQTRSRLACLVQHPPAQRVFRPPAEKPILVPLDLIRPTQAAVGMRAVAAKREKVETRALKRRKMMAFLEKRPIPAVRGPGEGYYIIDHHHLSLALWQSDVDEAFVRVIEDLSGLGRPTFWRAMAATGWMHPYDETGRRIPATELPSTLYQLRSDPYRDLAWSVREEGGFEKSRAPYAEFRWAQFFRERIAPTSVKRNYDRALDKAMLLARSRDARHLPGYVGR